MNACAALSDFGFVSVGRDRKLRIWNSQNQNHPEAIDTGHTHSVKSVAATPDGAQIATGSYNGTFSVYDRLAEKWIYSSRLTHAGISSINPCSDGFIASSYDGTVYRVPMNTVKSEGNSYVL